MYTQSIKKKKIDIYVAFVISLTLKDSANRSDALRKYACERGNSKTPATIKMAFKHAVVSLLLKRV